MLFFLSLASTAKVEQEQVIDVTGAEKATYVLKKAYKSWASKAVIKRCSASESELQSISALVTRAYPNIHSDVDILPIGAEIGLSIQLPLPKFIRYLNISTMVFPSEHGLQLSNIDIGHLSIPSQWLFNTIKWSLDVFLKDALGSQLVDTIKTVKIHDKQLIVAYQLPKQFNKSKTMDYSLWLDLRETFALFGDAEHIKYYHEKLLEHIDYLAQLRPHQSYSLSYYLGYMFAQAELKFHLDDDTTAVSENSAALMALALYFGADNFELLVGEMTPLSKQQKLRRKRLKGSVALKGRVDLQQHFIYSVALQLFSTSDASGAVGEFKELLDSNTGGSGFSFADLLADRAGTRLAMVATTDETTARKVQAVLAKAQHDSAIMPNLLGLPEGLNQAEFESHFRNVESSQYLDMIDEIDQRLAEVTVFKISVQGDS